MKCQCLKWDNSSFICQKVKSKFFVNTDLANGNGNTLVINTLLIKKQKVGIKQQLSSFLVLSKEIRHFFLSIKGMDAKHITLKACQSCKLLLNSLCNLLNMFTFIWQTVNTQYFYFWHINKMMANISPIWKDLTRVLPYKVPKSLVVPQLVETTPSVWVTFAIL